MRCLPLASAAPRPSGSLMACLPLASAAPRPSGSLMACLPLACGAPGDPSSSLMWAASCSWPSSRSSFRQSRGSRDAVSRQEPCRGRIRCMSPESPLRWSLVIPVKVLALAKSRLTGLSGPRRAELALAMAADTVAAAAACAVVGSGVVVTDDAAAAALLSGLGALVVPDEPGDGLNPALTFGAAQAGEFWPGRGRAGVAARLPWLAPAELGREGTEVA